MNLIHGKRMDVAGMAAVMAALPGGIARTLQAPPPPPALVVDACDRLAAALPDEAVLPVLESLGVGTVQAKRQLANLRLMFSREYLEHRLETELGSGFGRPAARTPFGLATPVTEQIFPLGVLFHIAAGNMDGLPVYSVIEGLLCGNINLLKLPAVDGGLSVMLLQKLCELAPELTDYIYVFELSSQETASIAALTQLADAVVVWGGDEAVQSVRKMAPPNVRVIEWGHKLSFAYVTKQGMTKAKLEGLAHGVCASNQLLCSSCQGVFVDAAGPAELHAFAETFLPVLEKVARGYPPVPLSARAQNSLQLYSRSLEGIYGDTGTVLRGDGVSLSVEAGDELAASLQFRNLWVKALPRERLVPALHPHKNHLQTAALLCGAREWDALRDSLWRAGVVRISGGAEMSDSYCGAAHDGDYPLRRYTRVVSAQK